MNETKDDLKREKVRIVPISNIEDFPDHPFQVKDDESMDALVESIRMNGVLNPVIALKIDENHYQLISGHRRKHACVLLGIDRIPLIGREMTKEEAVIEMVDSNLQREHILPSEKARAYKMKMDAMKNQGKRTDLTSSPLGTKLRTDEIIAQEAGESRNQIQRFIRLTNLIPEILDMVDNKKIALNPAVELSYLSPAEQEMLVVTMDSEQATPSLSQAQRLKRFSQDGKLTEESMLAIMSEEKKQDMDRVTLTRDTLRKYFPRDYTPRQMEDTILKLLQGWSKKRQQSHER